jgi:hypothetical protein
MEERILSKAEKAFIHHGVQVSLNSVGLLLKEIVLDLDLDESQF